jgi:hypothetical protein
MIRQDDKAIWDNARLSPAGRSLVLKSKEKRKDAIGKLQCKWKWNSKLGNINPQLKGVAAG